MAGHGCAGVSQTLYDKLLDGARAEAQTALDEAVEQVPAGLAAATRLVDSPAVTRSSRR